MASKVASFLWVLRIRKQADPCNLVLEIVSLLIHRNKYGTWRKGDLHHFCALFRTLPDKTIVPNRNFCHDLYFVPKGKHVEWLRGDGQSLSLHHCSERKRKQFITKPGVRRQKHMVTKMSSGSCFQDNGG